VVEGEKKFAYPHVNQNIDDKSMSKRQSQIAATLRDWRKI